MTGEVVAHAVSAERAFVSYLLEHGWIDDAGTSRMITAHTQTGESFCRLLSRLGVIEEAALVAHISRYLKCPVLNEAMIPSTPPLLGELRREFFRTNVVLPLDADSERVVLAVADPFADDTLKAVALATDRRVDIVAGELALIERSLNELYRDLDTPLPEEGPRDESMDYEDADLERLKDLAAEAPVIRMVNQIIQNAVAKRASDIHIEPFQQQLRVRFRVDGLLNDEPGPPGNLRAAIVSRIKVMARLNIAERRLPQDGRIRIAVRGKEIDLRVSTFPTMHGESVVLRVLDRGSVALELEGLGFSDNDLACFKHVLKQPMGLVLVTGPTGSGKTTTLYSALRALDSTQQKIFTIEDPIEYELPGINQTQVKPQVGLNFANSLRSLMRQDPDVILIGEIRDPETAETAAQSSLTGHKVLSTLHTNDAVTAISRLIDMGVPRFLIAATLECVVAQRLVRVLCSKCRIETTATPELQRLAEQNGIETLASIYEPVGCESCGGTGYRGRTAIYEILLVSDELRSLTQDEVDTAQLRFAASRAGMTSIRKDGFRQILSGVTTLAEVQRVTTMV